jgi:hypothetical protein
VTTYPTTWRFRTGLRWTMAPRAPLSCSPALSTCGNCGEQFLDSEKERKPCPACQSTGPRTREVVAAAIVAIVILILGVAANEVWGLEVHQHHEHFPDL